MFFAGLDGNSLYNPLLHNRAVHLGISWALNALLEFLGCEEHFAALDSEEMKHAEVTGLQRAWMITGLSSKSCCRRDGIH